MAKLSVFLMGQGVIALKGLETLIKTSYNILGVCSSDNSLETLCRTYSILHISNHKAFYDLLLNSQYDYLFSVNNQWIIPPEILKKSKTINYHNSLLPKYAGLNASSWALIHGETQQGITWHEVVPEIDAGAILKQISFPILENDTAFSLNNRCFEAAVKAFEELISELKNNSIEGIEQNPSQRSYFGGRDCPEAACILDFEQPTQKIYNLIRGLNFGFTRNPLGLPKIWLPGGVVAVGVAQPEKTFSNAIAGQVLSLNEEGLCISTVDGAIKLTEITNLQGKKLSQDELCHQYQVIIGMSLPVLSLKQRELISSRNLEIHRYENSWVKTLVNLNPCNHPYLERNNSIIDRQGVSRYSISLPDKTLETSFLLAVFSVYCALVSKEQEFDLGLQTEAQRSIAPELFAQQVPLRIQTKVNDSFADFQKRFNKTLTQAKRFRSYALDVFARYPKLRNYKHNQAFPITIAIVDSPSVLKFESLNCPLALVAYEDGSQPQVIQSGTMTHFQAETIAQQIETLISTLIQNPTQTLQSLSLLSAIERQKILWAWNQTAKPYPSNYCVHELFSQQAARTPDAVAVCFEQRRLTYHELDVLSNKLAYWLNYKGIQPGTLVAICLPRSVELLIGLLGILKSGGAYVPIDPTYPNERIAYMLSDSCADAVVTLASLRDQFFPNTDNVICLDEEAFLLANGDLELSKPRVKPQDLAYVIYTSGSTGKPKGVEIEHRSVVNHSWAIADNYKLGIGDRVLQSASISFDVAAEQIYPALFRGAEVVIRPNQLMESFERFSDFIEQQNITAMILPTAFWHEWVVNLASTGKKVPQSLRMLSVGTEMALSNRLNQWQDLSEGRVAFFQGYGPTEATITCTMYIHEGNKVSSEYALPIGRPLPNTEIYILDSQLQPVPIGIVGEIYVGGDGLARGYHHRPNLTEKSFIPHPFYQTGDKRLYKTGDLAFFAPDGQIMYCGRGDNQIKIRGFRLELAEIESIINQNSKVKTCVVIVKEDRPGDKYLVAYVVLIEKQEGNFTSKQLRQFLEQRLPNYMIPSAFVFLESLPLTPTGKVDRRALPAPELSQLESEKTLSAPRNELELQLSQIWRTVLGIETIDVKDNFFDLGGHSLLALKLFGEIEKTFQKSLSLNILFQAPTIEQLSNILRQEKDSTWSSLVAIQPNGFKPPLFCIHAVGPSILNYQNLIPYLDPNQPVYGLQAKGLDGEENILTRIEDMAAHYIKEIRTFHPKGPYCLAGHSFGGIIAFEMAQQLFAQGQKIALLALLDTMTPENYKNTAPWYYQIYIHCFNLFRLKDKSKLSYFLERKPKLINRLWEKITGKTNFGQNPSLQEELPEIYQLIEKTDREAYLHYSPVDYPDKLTLFRAIERPTKFYYNPYLGWRNLVSEEIEICEVPGHHLTMIQEPNVQILAKNLTLIIDKSLEDLKN